jgi:hypothetical protein
LNYGTGPGAYLGAVDGDSLAAGTTLNDSDAKRRIQSMLDAGLLHADQNTLFMLILPDGVTSRFDGDGSMSCSSFCGYHESFNYHGTDVAYAILTSPTGCQGCGNGEIGDFTAVYAHELAEAVTDKVPGKGWVADDGQENGDLEAWILFGWGPASNPNLYTVQGYYTNERGNTVGAWSSSMLASVSSIGDGAATRSLTFAMPPGPSPCPDGRLVFDNATHEYFWYCPPH